MSVISSPVSLPTVVQSKLRQVRQRTILIRAAEALLRGCSVLLLGMMAAMAVDAAIVLFDVRWRVMLTAVVLVAVSGVLLAECIRGVLNRRGASSVARAIDGAVPALQERWSTVAELAESRDPPEIRGSQGLIDRVLREAADLSHLVAADKVVRTERLRGRAIVLAAAAGLLGVLFLCVPREASFLLRRFWAPTRAITLTQVASITGDRVVGRGEPLTIEARGEGRLQRSAMLSLRSAAAERGIPIVSTQDLAMHFKHEIDSPQQSFDYRFRAGDGQTSWNKVTVVDRPSIAQIHFELTPPAYSKLPAEAKDALPLRCRALQGSRLRVSFRASKPLSRFELRFEGGRVQPLVSADEQWYRFDTELNENFAFSPWLFDAFGMTNLAPPTCRVTVYADQPPSVEIISPRDEITVRPDDRIEIEFKARDDFGIGAAELVVTSGEGKNEKEVLAVPIPLGSQQDSKSVSGKVALDLKPLALKQGAQLHYEIRVSDTRQASAAAQIASEVSNNRTAGIARRSASSTQPAASSSRESNENAASPGTQPEGKVASSTTTQPDAADQQQATTQPSHENGRGQAASSPKSATSRPEEDSNSPPSNNMTTRRLLKPTPSASQKQRIVIDRWAGSFAGQARQKLQIAVDGYLKRLDAALADAQSEIDRLRRPTPAAQKKDEDQTSGLAKARGHLAEAERAVADLRKESRDTPYAFVGLQLHNIAATHVTPARNLLTSATTRPAGDAALQQDFDGAWYHVTRARELLADLTRKYEAVKREEKLTDAVEHIAKMHQIFVEDMYALLKSCKPSLNPRKNKMLEVPDGFAEQMQQSLEGLKQVMGELSKVLAEDPELLRRYLASRLQESTTLRDQVTLLAQRQKRVHEHVSAASTQPADMFALAPAGYVTEQVEQQNELARSIAQLHDSMVTWMPRQSGRARKSLSEAEAAAAEAARLAHDVSASISAGKLPDAIATAEQAVTRLNAIHMAVFDAGSGSQPDSELSVFAAHRLSEVQKMIAGQNVMIQKLEAVSDNKYPAALGRDLSQLREDTLELSGKLVQKSAKIRAISRQAFKLLNDAASVMSGEIAEQQLEAGIALKVQRGRMAVPRTTKAVEGFARVEQLLDGALTALEQARAANPPPLMVPSPPRLADLLAMLEKEADAIEKLGDAGLRLNLAIQGDWEGSGEGGGGGQGEAKGSAGERARQNQEAAKRTAQAQARAAREAAEKLQREAEKTQQERDAETRNDAQARAGQQDKPGQMRGGVPAGNASQDGTAEGRDFNVFVSKLEQEISQSRATVPPRQYREAIDAYFEIISESVNRSKE